MYFPLFLNLDERRVLVIGAGAVALAKLETLRKYAQRIRVIGRRISPEVQAFAKKNGIPFHQTDYRASQLDASGLVIAATNDPALNERISEDCRERRIPVNVVDAPGLSDFIFGAIVQRGTLGVAVSTSGISPVLARLVKEKIHRLLPEGILNLNEFLRRRSAQVRRRLPALQPRRLFWQNFLESPAAEAIVAGNAREGSLKFDEALERQDNANRTKVFFIGAGPGDPELVTVKAVQWISRADTIIHDRLVSEGILEYARRDAKKIDVGKSRNRHPVPQEEINRLIVEHALRGEIVVRLKGGDCAIFAHLAEEIERVKAAGVDFQIIPGVSSASGAAAYAGFPLTSRAGEKSVRLLTLFKSRGEDEAYWKNLADSGDFLVFYMSSHRAAFIAERLLEAGKSPKTPVAVVEQSTTPFQRTHRSTLARCSADFENAEFVSPSLLVIGENLNFNPVCRWKEENRQGLYFQPVETDENGKAVPTARSASPKWAPTFALRKRNSPSR